MRPDICGARPARVAPAAASRNVMESKVDIADEDLPSHTVGILRRLEELSDEPGERLSNAARKLVEKITTADAPEEELLEMARALEEINRRLESFPIRTGRTGFSSSATETDVTSYLSFGPLTGKLNPIAPPLDIKNEDNQTIGHVNFGYAYEGPPGHVHGGYIAAMFDELLGFAQGFSGQPGVTGTLTIRYRRPTPLKTDLRLVGTFDRIEGRKIYTTGKMYANGELTADATGVFVMISKERYKEIGDKSTELRAKSSESGESAPKASAK